MTLDQLNQLPLSALREQLQRCCGAAAWVDRMVQEFPVPDEATLLQAAHDHWFRCTEADWREAFSHHPMIGDVKALREKFRGSGEWAGDEQASVRHSPGDVLESLAAGNKAYLEKFGYIFIVCATGKSAPEMLALLEARLPNEAGDEIRLAMQEQDKITQLRLQKLLQP